MANLIPVKLHYPSTVVHGQMPDERSPIDGFDTSHLMALAKKRAKNSARFDEHPPYFWRSRISNDRMDSYYTRMHESTLTSFAKGSKDGVSFQYSHDWKKLGLGMSLDGLYRDIGGSAEGGNRATQETVADFYTVPGLKMNDQMSTDDFILGVDTGILQDVSVGFYAGAIKCGICGGDLFQGWFGLNGKCGHFPGDTYEILDDKGNVTGEQLAYAWIHDGALSEVSQVFDGACPDAGHLKAELWADSGKLDGRSIRHYEALYRMKLPHGAIVVPVQGEVAERIEGMARAKRSDEDKVEVVIEEPQIEESNTVIIEGITEEGPGTTTEGDDEEGDEEDGFEDERAMLADVQARFSGEGITLASTARSTIEGLCRAVVSLRSDAKDGRAYRNDEIERAVKSGVSALGDQFDEKSFRSVAKGLPVSDIKAQADMWKATAAIRWPEGRKSTDDVSGPSDDEKNKGPERAVPVSARNA